MSNTVPGFKSMSCYKRPVTTLNGVSSESTMQWIFSDGLASVSLFVEAFDRRKHVYEGSMTIGATSTMTKRLGDKAGDWWLTVVGEVPRNTLIAFAQGLERKR